MVRKEKGGSQDVDAQWTRVRGRLKSEFGDVAFKSWLQPLRLADVRDGQVRMSVPTRFMREWVMSRYADRIRALWSVEEPSVRSITIGVHGCGSRPAEAGGAVLRARSADETADDAPDVNDMPAPAEDAMRKFGGALDSRFTFDNFVVGKSNEFAHA
ncbi:MAG: DnaA N-terminal domain-containing protein, partial [Alphaproteobacteria bacterium]